LSAPERLKDAACGEWSMLQRPSPKATRLLAMALLTIFLLRSL
jgi:hypothetical protein